MLLRDILLKGLKKNLSDYNPTFDNPTCELDRHERKSIIITSQYPSSSWYDMVGDPTVADAILDRIVHSAHYIELTGENMRNLKAKKA